MVQILYVEKKIKELIKMTREHLVMKNKKEKCINSFYFTRDLYMTTQTFNLVYEVEKEFVKR